MVLESSFISQREHRSCRAEWTHLLIKAVFDTFDRRAANQTRRDFKENRKNKQRCHYITVNQAELKRAHYSGLFISASGGKFTLFFRRSSPICFGKEKAIYRQTKKRPRQFSILPYSHLKLN